MPTPEFTDKGATFSSDRVYRYALWRRWEGGDGQDCVFIMLNPSTADESVLDPTVTRCVGFARDWGYSGLIVANIFALRATDPRKLLTAVDPIGPQNNQALIAAVLRASCVICAWGVHGKLNDREHEVLELLNSRKLECLGVTKGGHPKHPLYLKRDTQRRPFGQQEPIAVR